MKCNCRQFISAGHIPTCDDWAQWVEDMPNLPDPEALITALRELVEKAEVLLKLDLCDTLQNSIGQEREDLEEATAKAKATLGEEKKGETNGHLHTDG